MRHCKSVICVLVVLAMAFSLSAQKAGRSSGSTSNSATTNEGSGNESGTNNETGTGPGRGEPCWKVAGISPSVIQQRKNIEQDARSKIAAACADSNLSAEQRVQQIHSIHQQAHQAIQALLTPQQEEALKACRAAREKGKEEKGKEPHPPTETESGPCGKSAEDSQVSSWANKPQTSK